MRSCNTSAVSSTIIIQLQCTARLTQDRVQSSTKVTSAAAAAATSRPRLAPQMTGCLFPCACVPSAAMLRGTCASGHPRLAPQATALPRRSRAGWSRGPSAPVLPKHSRLVFCPPGLLDPTRPDGEKALRRRWLEHRRRSGKEAPRPQSLNGCSPHVAGRDP